MNRNGGVTRIRALGDLALLAFGLLIFAVALACFGTGEWGFGVLNLFLGWAAVDMALERVHR